jgi:integrase
MVRLRGNVWYVRLTFRDDTGKKKQKWVSLPGVTSERGATREEARLLTEQRAGALVVPGRKRLGPYLEEWLSGLRTRGLQERTLVEYEHKVRRHLIPRLGEALIADLTTARIRRFYAMLLEKGRLDGKGGLDPATVERIHCILKQALQQAVDDGDLLKNPAAAKKMAPKQQQKEISVLGEVQTAALLAAAAEQERGTELYLPLLVLATTALRRNEALGLRWQDCDLERGLVTVNQTLTQLKGGVKIKPSPKNTSSRRTIQIPAVTVEALRVHREEQFARRQALGEEYHDQGLVFERGDGTPIRPTTFSNAVAALARKVDLPGVHVHSLRHGHISQLIAQNAPMKAISVRAGHSKIQTTMNIYGHLLPGVEDEMVARFDASFRAAMEQRG